MISAYNIRIATGTINENRFILLLLLLSLSDTSSILPLLPRAQTVHVQGSAKRRAPGCVNAAGKVRQKC